MSENLTDVKNMKPAYTPNTKIIAAGSIGLPASIILAWVLTQFGVTMPPEVAAAVGALLSTVIGYMKRDTMHQ